MGVLTLYLSSASGRGATPTLHDLGTESVPLITPPIHTKHIELRSENKVEVLTNEQLLNGTSIWQYFHNFR